MEHDQSAKADAGKLQLNLVPPAIIKAVARIRMFGTRKYKDPENWRKVEADRYWQAALRHMLAAWNDWKKRDEESGEPHIAHICCNLAFLLQMMEEKSYDDDDDTSHELPNTEIHKPVIYPLNEPAILLKRLEEEYAKKGQKETGR